GGVAEVLDVVLVPVQHVVDHLLARQAHDVVALRLGLRLSRGPCPLPLIAGEGLGAAQQVVLPDGRTLLLALRARGGGAPRRPRAISPAARSSGGPRRRKSSRESARSPVQGP